MTLPEDLAIAEWLVASGRVAWPEDDAEPVRGNG